MKTRADLVTKVLDLLNVTQTGQEPAAEDYEKVDQDIDGLIGDLAAREIFYLQDVEQFDDVYLTPIATILASRVGPLGFGTPRNRDVEMQEEWRLRDIDRRPGGNPPLSTEYF